VPLSWSFLADLETLGRTPPFFSGKILVTPTAYFALHDYADLRAHAFDQICQGEQVRRAEQRSPG